MFPVFVITHIRFTASPGAFTWGRYVKLCALDVLSAGVFFKAMNSSTTGGNAIFMSVALVILHSRTQVIACVKLYAATWNATAF